MGTQGPIDRAKAAAAALAALAEHVAAGDRVDVLLDRTCALLAEVLPASSAAIVLLGEDLKPVVAGASNGALRAESLRQFELDEGPCVDAAATGEPVAEFAVEERAAERWPRWAPTGLEPKAGALLAVPIPIAGRVAGVLGLGWDEPGQPDEDEAELGTQVATVVVGHAMVLGTVEAANLLASQLEHALQSRVVIEQAKGMLAERLEVTLTEAYRMLRSHARSRRTRVHRIAEQVVSGKLELNG
jgi:transcriptional regulator with GAF, ATPase, and Fis domain